MLRVVQKISVESGVAALPASANSKLVTTIRPAQKPTSARNSRRPR